MKTIVLAGMLALSTAAADAQTAPSGATQAERICTTTTVVVRRGEAVLSSTSSTKCEGEQSRGGLNLGGALTAPQGLLEALGKGHGAALSPTNARGDWRTVEPGSHNVCHVFLSAVAGAEGYRVRTTQCRGPVARAATWRFEGGAVGLYDAAGGLVRRLSGDRDRMSDGGLKGEGVVLER